VRDLASYSSLINCAGDGGGLFDFLSAGSLRPNENEREWISPDGLAGRSGLVLLTGCTSIVFDRKSSKRGLEGTGGLVFDALEFARVGRRILKTVWELPSCVVGSETVGLEV
jgi:hypothetical protein